MRKVLISVVAAALLLLAASAVAFANPPRPACNGLDVAHSQVHGTGSQQELTLHDLRAGNHCGH